MENRRRGWMIAPKGFIRLVGAEYELLNKAGKNVLAKFYVSSLLIVGILIFSFLSIHHAVDLLVHSEIIETILSIFFSVLFVFIYVFLLNTFTKQQVDTNNKFFQLANFIRVGFVVFMAFLISKPIEIFVFNKILDHEVEVHKAQLLEEQRRKLDAFYATQLSVLQGKVGYYQTIPNAGSVINSYLSDANDKIKEIADKKAQTMEVITDKVQQSSFFIFRIQQLATKHKTSYLVCFFVIILFLSPGFIIYNISKDDQYYKLKREYEIGLVNRGYQAFLQYYKETFLIKFKHATEYYTVFEDPPFNKKRKSDNHYQADIEFFKKYRSGV